MADDFVMTLDPLREGEDDGPHSDDSESELEMAKNTARPARKKRKKKSKKQSKSKELNDEAELPEGGGGGFVFDNGDGEGLASSSGRHVRQQSVVDKIQRRLLIKEDRKGEEEGEDVEADNEKSEEGGHDLDSDFDEDADDDEDEDEEDEDDDEDEEEEEKEESEEVTKSKRGNKGVRQMKDFSQLKLSRPLQKAVGDMGFVKPTPVQAMSIPHGLKGKDLLVNAQTGSGKTAAFLLPVFERLLYRPRRIPVSRVLVVTPTRELAQQILHMGKQLSKHSDIRLCLVVGGLSLNSQAAALRTRPDVVVATPGRLVDHLRNTVAFDLDGLEVLILDEADRLLDMGFKDEIMELVRLCPRERQTMLFSATLNSNVTDLVDLSLKEPIRIKVDAVSVVDTLTQEFIRVRPQNDTQEWREAVVIALCARGFKAGRCIVFMPSKKQAHRLMILFGLLKLKAAELHGQLTQQQRLDALDLFHEGKVDFLIATDLAARGLDIKGVVAVINFNMPRQLERYIHRVGRTARAGRKGIAVTLIGESSRKNLKSVVKMAKEATRSRTVPAKVVAKWMQKIKGVEEDVRAVLQMEYEEKQLRIAEMESNRSINIMQYQDQIQARPARTWFQTEKQKRNIKEISKAAALAEDSGGIQVTQQESTAMKKASKPSKNKKKDPLLGLSRAKKRRRMQRMAEERSREDYERKIEEMGGTAKKSPAQRMAEAARKAKTDRRPTKSTLDGDQKSVAGAIRRAKNRYKSSLDEEEADSFGRRYAKVGDKLKDDKKKKFKAKSRNSFKSKGRYKRRK